MMVLDRPLTGITDQTSSASGRESRILENQSQKVASSFWDAATSQIGLREALTELDDLRTLEADWNGEGAPVIDAEAIDIAHLLLSTIHMPTQVVYSVNGPDVAPNPDGGVSLSWHFGKSLLWIIISPQTESITVVTRNQHDVVKQTTSSFQTIPKPSA